MENVILTTNPAMVNIAKTKNFPGINILLYHGFSMDYYMDGIETLRLANAKLHPDKIMHYLLKRRHLCPTYRTNPFSPDSKDPMIIRETPDIFVAAHIHKSAISTYNGILTIACSCWQRKTSYQEKFGHEPDPCKVSILNLKT